MSRVCRNILIWAVSVTTAIPATALEGRAESKPRTWNFNICAGILWPLATPGPLPLGTDLSPYLRVDIEGRSRNYSPLPWGEGGEWSELGEGSLRHLHLSSPFSVYSRPLTSPPPADESAARGTPSPQGRGLGVSAFDSSSTASASDTLATQPSNVQDADERREQEQEKRDREQEARDHAQEQIDRERELYNEGTEAIDEGKLQRAIDKFNQVSERHGAHAEGALYWKAYAQNRLGQRPDALETLVTLRRTYPKSRWLDDAKALEVEVRQSSGQSISPEAEANEDLKLIAINSLLGTDPEQALPMLEKFLNGAQSLKLKERALFVLSQSGSPKAREVIGRIATGNRNPELQMKAIQDLGLFGGKESRATLEEIYKSSHDGEVKRAILQSFMMSGERERLLEVAKREQSPELRAEAVKQLGVMGARAELYQLYQTETSSEVKKRILQAIFVGGDVEHTFEVARTEKDSELRRQAVRNLGLMGKDKTAEALTSIYNNDEDPEIKRAVIQAFFLQGNAKPLIQIARQEKDMSLKRGAVQKLSLMHSKESTDFMMELLNKP